MTDFSDREMVQRMQAGDTTAFKTIFLRYYTSLCLFANDYLGNPQRAEEIVSDVFANVWENRQRLPLDGLSPAYFRAAVFNRSINESKRGRLRQLYLDYAKNNPAFFEDDNTPGRQLEIRENIRLVQQAVQALPERCREVFLLSRFQNMRYKDIARQLGISPKTVENQVQIAIGKLREALKHLPLLFIFF